MAPAGRRSGKTELGKRKLTLALHDCWLNPRPWDDPRFFAGAPTRDQAKRIFWQDLKKLTPPHWVERIYESDLMIRTHWGAELWVVGLDVAERVEGVSWDGCVIDELANCKPGTWQAHIRPALSDRKGWAWLIGVPDMEAPGQVEYKRMYEIARDGLDPEWAAFHWPSSDILPPEEIESARRAMDPDLFAQEYGGSFVLASGLAFPSFDYKTHVRADIAKYDPALPLCWSLDFNVNPMCSGIIQHRRGEVRVLKEFTLADSDTNVACDAFLDYIERAGWEARGVYVYGDATGSARDSTSGTTDWTIVRNRLKNLGPHFRVPGSNPAVKDTLNALRALLKSADGAVHLYIHPDCRRLISDFQEALWPSDLSEQHAIAWMRYFADREYPVKIEREGGARYALG